MKRLAVAALALLTTAAPTPAHAFVSSVVADTVCQMASATDVTREAGWNVAVVTGAVVDHKPGTLACQVWVNNAYYDGEVVAGTVGNGSVQVAVVAGLTNFRATAADSIALCAVFTDGNTQLKEWWAPGPAGGGSWQQPPVNPSRCAQAITVNPSGTACPVLLAADYRLGTNLAEVWQDCEGYAPIV